MLVVLADSGYACMRTCHQRGPELKVTFEVAETPESEFNVAEPVSVVIKVTGNQVTLTGPLGHVRAPHGGVPPGLSQAVHEVRHRRAGMGLDPGTAAADTLSLARAGRLLAESFLPDPIADEFRSILRAARSADVPVRIGLAVPSGLAWLPWDALPDPFDQRPLALQPLISIYRQVQAGDVRRLPGPLRIVVAIAAPEYGGGALLDYERELRNVLAAVRSARRDAADVRVVPFATPGAIRAELDRREAHVLHISGHGSPGRLDLEDEDGIATTISAEEFVSQAIPPGKMPPVVTLSACYTDAAGGDGASFASRLCEQGAVAVIATETSVTDTYATKLLARVYATLASARYPDVVAAFSAARREVQADLEASGDRRDRHLATLGEWAAFTILTAVGSVPIVDPGAPAVRPPRCRDPGSRGSARGMIGTLWGGEPNCADTRRNSPGPRSQGSSCMGSAGSARQAWPSKSRPGSLPCTATGC